MNGLNLVKSARVVKARAMVVGARSARALTRLSVNGGRAIGSNRRISNANGGTHFERDVRGWAMLRHRRYFSTGATIMSLSKISMALTSIVNGGKALLSANNLAAGENMDSANALTMARNGAPTNARSGAQQQSARGARALTRLSVNGGLAVVDNRRSSNTNAGHQIERDLSGGAIGCNRPYFSMNGGPNLMQRAANTIGLKKALTFVSGGRALSNASPYLTTGYRRPYFSNRRMSITKAAVIALVALASAGALFLASAVAGGGIGGGGFGGVSGVLAQGAPTADELSVGFVERTGEVGERIALENTDGTGDFSVMELREGELGAVVVQVTDSTHAQNRPTADYTVRVTLTGDGVNHIAPIEGAVANAEYDFEAEAGTFTALDSSLPRLSVARGGDDDGVYAPLDIGFAFEFYGTDYEQIWASTNGFLSFTDITGDTATNGTINLARAVSPGLMPLWDDLHNGVAINAPVAVRSQTIGQAPNRVFVYEVLSARWNFQASVPVSDYQVRLYEGTNVVEFVYDTGNAGVTYGSPNSPSATIGIAQSGSNFITLSDESASPTAQNNVFTSNIDARPADDQVYRFTPMNKTITIDRDFRELTGQLRFVPFEVLNYTLDGAATATLNAAFALVPETTAALLTETSADLTLRAAVGLTATLSADAVAPGAPATLTVATADNSNVSEDVGVRVDISGALARFGGLDALVGYDFVAEQGAYSRPDTRVPTLTLPSDRDTGVLGPIDIGFPFELYGESYEQLRATTNGALSFNAGATDADIDGIDEGGQEPFNTLGPALLPLLRNSDFRAATARAGAVGTAPNRVFIYEARDVDWDKDDTAAGISYQVRLYEGTNAVEYIYEPSGAASSKTAWLVGIARSGSDNLTLRAGENNSLTAPIADFNRINEINLTEPRPAAGQIYRFIPRGETTVTILNGSSSGTVTLTPASDIAPGDSYQLNLELLPDTGGYEPTRATSSLSLSARREPLSLTASLSDNSLAEGEATTLTLTRGDDAVFNQETVTVRVTLSGDADALLRDGAPAATGRVAGAYAFEAEAGVWEPLETSVAPLTQLSRGTGRFNLVPLSPRVEFGFDFPFYGRSYDGAIPSAQGTLSFNPNVTDGLLNLAYAPEGRMGAFNSDRQHFPAIMPFFDEEVGGGGAQSQTIGTAPNRVFVYQVTGANWSRRSNANPVLDYQVRLYEGTGVIEFVYNIGAGYAAPAPSTHNGFGATIGIADSSTAFATLDDATADARARTDFFVNDLGSPNLVGRNGVAFHPGRGLRSAPPPSGQLYRFTPAGAGGAFFDVEIGADSLDNGRRVEVALTAKDDIFPGDASSVGVSVAALSRVYATPADLAIALSDDDPTIELTAALSATSIVEGESLALTITAPVAVDREVRVRVDVSGPGAQLIYDYELETEVGTYAALETASSRAIAFPHNDDVSDPIDIGFDFLFYGETRTWFRATTTHAFTFRSAAELGDGNFEFRSNLLGSSQGRRRDLAPGFATLGGNAFNRTNEPGGGARVQTSGDAPNRVFTYQNERVLWGGASDGTNLVPYETASIDYQIKLYEGSNAIEYIYNIRDGYVAPAQEEAVIGIYGSRDQLATVAADGALQRNSDNPIVTVVSPAAYPPIIEAGRILRFIPPRFDATIPAGGTEARVQFAAFDDARQVEFDDLFGLDFASLTAGYSVSPETAAFAAVDNDPLDFPWTWWTDNARTVTLIPAPAVNTVSEGQFLTAQFGYPQNASGLDVDIRAVFSGKTDFLNLGFTSGQLSQRGDAFQVTRPLASHTGVLAIQNYSVFNDGIPGYGETLVITFVSDNPGVRFPTADSYILTTVGRDNDTAVVTPSFAQPEITQGNAAVLDLAISSPAHGAAEDVTYDVTFSGDATALATVFGTQLTHTATIPRGAERGQLLVSTMAQTELAETAAFTATLSRTSGLAYNLESSAIGLLVGPSQLRFAAEFVAETVVEGVEAVLRLTPDLAVGETLDADAEITVTPTGDAAALAFLADASPQTVNFMMGDDSAVAKTVRFATVGDMISEPGGALTFVFSGAGVSVSPSQLGLFVADDDAQTVTASLSRASIGEGEFSTLTVRRPTATPQAFEFRVALSGDLARIAGAAGGETTVVIAAGQLTGTQDVPQLDNERADGAGSLGLRIVPLTHAIAVADDSESLVLRLTDDDVRLAASFADAEIDEGQTARLTLAAFDGDGNAATPATAARVRVTLSGADVRLLNGVGGPEITGAIELELAGAPSREFALASVDDDLAGGRRTASVELEALTFGARFADVNGDPVNGASAAFTLADDDELLSPSYSTLGLDEGDNLTIEVGRPKGGDTAGAVTISVEASGAGVAGLTADSLSQTLTIADGAMSGSVTLTALNDHAPGADEAVTLTLTPTAGQGYSFGRTELETTAILNLLDNDTRLIAELSSESIGEGQLSRLTVRTFDGQPAHSDVATNVTLSGDRRGVVVRRGGVIEANNTFSVSLDAGDAQDNEFTFTAIDDDAPGAATNLRILLREFTDGYYYDPAPAFTAINDRSEQVLNLALTDDDVELTPVFTRNPISESGVTVITVTRPAGSKDFDQAVSVRAAAPVFSRQSALEDGETATIALTFASETQSGTLESGTTQFFNFAIAANETTSAAFTLTALNNDVRNDGTNLRFVFTVQSPAAGFGFRAGADTVNLRVNDDDGLTVEFVDANGLPVSAIDGNGGAATLRATTNGSPATENVRVRATLSGADAAVLAGLGVSQDLTIAEGSDQPFDIAFRSLVGSDNLPASQERTVTINLELIGAGALVLVSERLTLTLVDNDVDLPEPTLSATSINERGADNAATLSVARPSGTSGDIAIRVGASGGRVTLSDGGVLTIADGANSGSITITAADNAVVDASDAVRLTLTPTTAGYGFSSVARAAAVDLTIVDDDVELSAAASAAAIEEGESVTLTVTRSRGAVSDPVSLGTDVTVNVAVPSGFTGASAITIAGGQNSGSATYTAFDDNVVGGSGDRATGARSFAFVLSENQDGFAFASGRSSQSVAVAVNDDALLTLIAPASVTAGETITLTIERPADATAGDAAVAIALSGNGASFVGLSRSDGAAIILDGRRRGAIELGAVEDIGDDADRVTLTLTSQTAGFAFASDPLRRTLELRPASTPQDFVSVRIAPGSLLLQQPGGSFTAGSLTRFEARYTPVSVAGELVRYGTNWQVISGGQFVSVADAGGSVEIVRDVATGLEIPQYTANVLPRAAGTARLQLTITELDANERPIPGTEILSNAITLTVVAPRVVTPPAPPPAPVNPPDVVAPTVIGGNEVADRESGGDFEGPANSGVVLPAGAVPSAIGFVGVALVELDAPPAPDDLPPDLGEFIEGALILDVTFETQRGVEVSILENAATVCLPVNEFILAAVDGVVERLQVVRYHNGSWGGLVSEYRADEGVICAESQVFSEFALTALPVGAVGAGFGAGSGGGADGGLVGALPQTGGSSGLLGSGIDLAGAPLWLLIAIALAGAMALVGGLVVIRRRRSAG